MDRRTVTLFNAQQGYAAILELWPLIKSALIAGHRLTLEVRPERRSDAQSRLMWSSLGDLSRQVVWHGLKLDAEEWKDVMTAAQHRQKVVPGVDGGFVVLGQRTSKMTKAEMCELTELIHAFGTQHGVKWSPASIAMDINELEQAT